VTFLKGLNDREKLAVLEFLSNDPMIRFKAPDLAGTLLNLRRSCRNLTLVHAAEEERSSLDLEFLAQRKGCRVERVEGPADRWRILGADDPSAPSGIERFRTDRRLTTGQALEILRALPDRSREKAWLVRSAQSGAGAPIAHHSSRVKLPHKLKDKADCNGAGVFRARCRVCAAMPADRRAHQLVPDGRPAHDHDVMVDNGEAHALQSNR
jgi:hypothetical protein